MNRRRLLQRLSQGAYNNLSFAEIVDLIEGFGFQLTRIRGSHHIFKHPEIPELVNIQEVRGQAKPYQIRQFLKLVEQYALVLGE